MSILSSTNNEFTSLRLRRQHTEMYDKHRTRICSTGSSYCGSMGSKSTLDSMGRTDSFDSYTDYTPRRHTLDQMPQYMRKRICVISSCETIDQECSSNPSGESLEPYMQRCSSSVVITDSYRNDNNVRERLRQSRRQAKSAGMVGDLNGEVSDEILTPFEALAGLKRESPAYWISCSYAHHSKSKTVDMVIRQTGVLPNLQSTNSFSKLSLEMTITYGKSRKQKKEVVLKRSCEDTSFKSSHVSFTGINEKDAKQLQVRFRIVGSRWLSKKNMSEWQMQLTDCHEKSKTQWQRVSFSQ